MEFTARTVSLQGIEARPVDVQCQLSRGPHSIQVVGLPGGAVREAKERICAAFYAHSLSLPPMRVTFNLSPADLPKHGSHYDLPMAIALLVNMELLPKEEIERTISLGELALDGSVDHVSGVLAAAIEAESRQLTLICPPADVEEASLLPDIEILSPSKLVHLIKHFRGRPIVTNRRPAEQPQRDEQVPDLADIKGLAQQKRALEIAAAGRHHLFMIGPPGAGKSLLASAAPNIMPPMTAREILDTTLVHSAAGILQDGQPVVTRPYYNPHHSASAPAIVGGGRDAKPGEISLAHNGVLFMDELPEFKREVLESLRQPLETSQIHISRANAHLSYPAKFLLIAAANPCPCGMLFDSHQWCNRAPVCGQRYLENISGPILDRFSLRMNVQRLSIEDIRNAPASECSEAVRNRTSAARRRQYERNGIGICNEDLPPKILDAFLDAADPSTQSLAARAMERFQFSARGFYRLIKIARTIADLDNREVIAEDDIAESVVYRVLELEQAPMDAQKAVQQAQYGAH